MSKRKPALFVACAYILGIVLGNRLDFSLRGLSILVILFGLLSFFFSQKEVNRHYLFFDPHLCFSWILEARDKNKKLS